MLKLVEVTIFKYKSVEETQSFKVEDDMTVLVGMNESGKTSVLEALAKTNYFRADEAFKFNATHDFPRREKKALDKSGAKPPAIACSYKLDETLLKSIAEELGEGVYAPQKVTHTTTYANRHTWGIGAVDKEKFLVNATKRLGIHSKALVDKLTHVKNGADLEKVIAEFKDEGKLNGLAQLKKYYDNKWDWDCPIQEYIAHVLLQPHLPKFLYYDEYYSLPSRISIEKLQKDDLESEDMKTAKALFELADINIDELVRADEFEDFIAELEATEATITEELFKYWTTNSNLDILFQIDKREEKDANNNVHIVEHILDIRVKNNRSRVSLPLRNRSKGFNWFFSFLVWFKKIQEDKDSRYILLLDEPGLNLHASAQADLLRFLTDLSSQYQILYTTHSPFMVQSERLQKVRTILETKKGSVISDSVHEKDPKTLFPLQAALGYNIAQNLFISDKNLLVEGIADLVFLQVMSSILETEKREGLKKDVTIVPTGGLDKVASFISLMRGNDLNMVCLLDSFTDQKGRQRLDAMIKNKLIRERQILFAHDFIKDLEHADLEDLFSPEDYLKLYKGAFPQHSGITLDGGSEERKPILSRIKAATGENRFNHYLPANWLAREGASASFFKAESFAAFEQAFKTINTLF